MQILNSKGQEVKEITKSMIRSKEKYWIDITNINESESNILRDVFGIHHLTIEDINKKVTRIKIEEFNSYLFCVFYGIDKKGKSDDFILYELDFIIGKNFIITHHRNNLETYSNLQKNKEKIKFLLSSGPEFVLYKLLDKEIENYFPILELLDDEIESIEEQIVKTPKPEHLAKVLNLKRALRLVKKGTYQQREKLSFLTKNDLGFISKDALPYFRDVYDHSIRVSDSIDNYRESVSEAFDAYMSAVSNNMNEVMKVLSIFATLALPMTVISGIYGTNFRVLPGSQGEFGFWGMILFMVLFLSGMLIFFRKRKWF